MTQKQAASNSGQQPTPARPSQKTFADDENGTDNSGFRARSTGRDATDSTDDVSAPKSDDEFLLPEETIRKRVTAPPTSPVEDDDDTGANEAPTDDSKENGSGSTQSEEPKSQDFQPPIKVDDKESDQQKTDDNESKSKNDSGANRVGPRFKLDEKVTWRVIPKRTRLSIRANFVNPTIVRTRLDVNADWVAVPGDTRIVSK